MLPSWINEAKKLHKEGCSYTKIGTILGISRKQIGYHLKQLGYAPHIDNNKNRTNHRKYTVDEDFFSQIDTEEKAYWLGFLYADGYVSEKTTQIELQLKEADYLHLVKFSSAVNSNRPIYQTKKMIQGKEYIGYRVTINSVKMRNDLISKGCVPKKTYDISFPDKDIVPLHLVHHFIRGYVDGDGCYTFTSGNKLSVEVIGTEAFLKGYIDSLSLHENTLHSFARLKHDKIKRVMYSGRFAENIIEQLYEDASVYLDRKYAIIKDFLPSYEEVVNS